MAPIVHFRPSLHSKFQIHDWLKVTSPSNLTNLRSADVNLSQSRIGNLEWSEVQKRTIISALIKIATEIIRDNPRFSQLSAPHAYP